MTAQKLFGTDGIRGDAATLFSNQFCFDIGRSFCRYLKSINYDKGIIGIGSDTRESSDRIKKNFIAGLNSKYEVQDQGVIPTPALNYFTKVNKVAGAIVTGSHISEKENGIKFFFDDEELPKKDEEVLEKIYYSQPEAGPALAGKIQIKKSNKAKLLYQDLLLRLGKNSKRKFKIVIDAGNGTQSEIIPTVLRKLGNEVLTINSDLGKPLLSRDTETENSFAQLQKEVVDKKAQMGFGFDSDGDRVIFVTEKGVGLGGEQSGAILAIHSPEKTIITPINTSQIMEKIGKEVIRTKVGVLHVVEMMKKHKTNVGLESNGGFISGELFYSRDGGTAAMKMLDILDKTGKSLGKLAEELPRFYVYKAKLACPKSQNSVILTEVRKAYQRYKTETLDGVKVWLDPETWILFRPSGNAEEFRVFAESKDAVEAESLVKKGLKNIETILAKN